MLQSWKDLLSKDWRKSEKKVHLKEISHCCLREIIEIKLCLINNTPLARPVRRSLNKEKFSKSLTENRPEN